MAKKKAPVFSPRAIVEDMSIATLVLLLVVTAVLSLGLSNLSADVNRLQNQVVELNQEVEKVNGTETGSYLEN